MAWDWEKLRQQQKKNQEKFGFGGGGDNNNNSNNANNGGGSDFNPNFNFDKFKGKFDKFKKSSFFMLLLASLIFFLLYSTFYTVSADEVGVIQRFGKFNRISESGLNFKIPFGIETVTKVKVKRIYKEEFGFRSLNPDSNDSESKEELSEALMLTGDLNVAVVPWIVQYRIKNPYDFLFKIRDARGFLRDMSEASMRLVVGDRGIDEVISKREEIAIEARETLQKELDSASAGIDIVTIEMKKTNVPTPVQASFNEVNQATQEKESLIYQAKEQYNKAIPSAKGEAQRSIEVAEGYAIDLVNRAEGDAKRFVALYEEYKNAKDITKRRLYLEALKDIYPKLGHKVILDANAKSVLPFLNVGEPINKKILNPDK